MADNADTLANFMEVVWSRGDAAAVDRFLAEEYAMTVVVEVAQVHTM